MKRIERPVRALDDGLFSLNQIQNVNCALGVVWNGFGEPMAPRLNELQLMKAGALLAPPISA